MDTPPRPGLDVLFAAVLGVAVMHAIGVVLITPVAVVVLFQPLSGIPLAVLALGLLAAATAGLFRLVTTRWRVGTAVTATLATAVAYVALLVRVGRYPMWWYPTLGIDLGGTLAAGAGAVVGALLLPRWQVRIVGGLAAVAIVVVAATPSLVAYHEQREIDQQASERYAAQQLRALTRPVTVELEGSRIAQTAAGEYISWLRIVTAEGAVLDVDTVPDDETTANPAFTCWLMLRDSGSFDDSVTMERYAGTCSYDGAGRWETVAGRALATRFEERTVIVKSPRAEFPLPEGDVRPASPAELRNAAGHLRLLTLGELRDLLAAIDYGDAG